jgi:hypothetical protein
MRTAIISAVLAACVTLAACVPTTTTVTSGPVPAVATGTAIPVGSARAVQVFEAVCGATLPNFAAAPRAMAANGITARSPEGTPTIYSATEDLSFQIQNGPGLGQTCSMVFGSKDSEGTVLSALSRFGAFGPSPFGLAAPYRGRATLVIFSGEVQRIGTTRYYNVRLLSER